MALTRNLTPAMSGLHTWGGLLFGWLLFAVVFTGTLAVFHHEIEMWMQPEIDGLHATQEEAVATAERVLRQSATGASRWGISLPENNGVVTVSWDADGVSESRALNAVTGEALSPRATEGGHFLVEVHYSLHGGTLGMWLVGATGLFMLAAIVSGIIIHKRFFKDFFTFRPHALAQRAWLDAHNASSVLTLPFQIMIAFTGIAVFHTTFLPAGVQVLYGDNEDAFHQQRFWPPTHESAGTTAPLVPLGPLVAEAERRFAGTALNFNVQHPGDANAIVTVYRKPDDRLMLLVDWVAFDGVTGDVIDSQTGYGPSIATDGVLVGLHFIQFGGTPARWIYFVLGLASSVMVATGLVLFTVKRRARHTRTQLEQRLFRAGESLNVAAVAGVVLACAAYLWANRLVPIDVDTRATWEVRTFFLTWLASLLHASARPPLRAWYEQLLLATFLCATLPLLNLATTGGGLLAPATAWTNGALVDLTALAMSLVLGPIAWRIGTRSRC